MGKTRFPCVAHTLNLVINNTVGHLEKDNVIARAIQRVKDIKDIVSHFHRSPKAKRLLKAANNNLREEGERKVRKLIQFVNIAELNNVLTMASINQN